MIRHEFDPWAEIERLRRPPAKAAKAAKAGGHFSRISSFSWGASPRCRSCLRLEARGVRVLRCAECGHTARPRPRRAPHDEAGVLRASAAHPGGSAENQEPPR